MSEQEAVKNYFLQTLREQPEDFLNQRRNSGIKFENSDDAQESLVDVLMNTDKKYQIQNLFNPSARYVSTYIYLSSTDAYEQGMDLSVLKFDINYLTPILNTRGVINVNKPIRDIVAMRLERVNFNALRATDLYEKNTDLERHQVRYTLCIEELSAQSFITANGQRFHWIIEPWRLWSSFTSNEVIQYQLNLYQAGYFTTYDQNRGWYRFASPISKLDSISLRFGNFNGNKNFTPEILTATVTQNSNPAELTFDFSFALGMYGGTIEILDFTTGDPVTDAALITAMNSTFYSSVDYFARTPQYTFSTLTQITVPVNLTTMTAISGTLQVRVRIQALFVTKIEFVCLNETSEYDIDE